MKRKKGDGVNKKARSLKCMSCFQKIHKKDAFCRKCGNKIDRIVFDEKNDAPITLENEVDGAEAETRLVVSPKQFTSDIPSKYILPFNLSEPLYMVTSFAPEITDPKDYHAGNAVVSYITEKTAFYTGRTPDQVIGFPIMRKKPDNIDLIHYENFGIALTEMLKGKDSYIYIKANNYYKNHKGSYNELRYEGSILPGHGKVPTMMFIFFKDVNELPQEQEKEIGKSLVPTIYMIPKD